MDSKHEIETSNLEKSTTHTRRTLGYTLVLVIFISLMYVFYASQPSSEEMVVTENSPPQKEVAQARNLSPDSMMNEENEQSTLEERPISKIAQHNFIIEKLESLLKVDLSRLKTSDSSIQLPDLAYKVGNYPIFFTELVDRAGYKTLYKIGVVNREAELTSCNRGDTICFYFVYDYELEEVAFYYGLTPYEGYDEAEVLLFNDEVIVFENVFGEAGECQGGASIIKTVHQFKNALTFQHETISQFDTCAEAGSQLLNRNTQYLELDEVEGYFVESPARPEYINVFNSLPQDL